MRVRVIGESKAQRYELLAEDYTDCRETVRMIVRQVPLLLEACLDEEEELAIQGTVTAVHDGWLAVTEFLDDIAERYGGEVYFSDLRREEETRVRLLIDEVYVLIDGYRGLCLNLGASSL